MDCREFREQHFALVDDTLSGVELVGMHVHLAECACCAEHDARIRRSLMLVRSLPTIEPSEGFAARLDQKLRQAKAADAALATRGTRARHFASAMTLTGAAMLAYIGLSLREIDRPQDLMLPPVVATASDPLGPPAPEMVASVPAGMPIWTAALFAEQTPVHFASLEPVSISR